MSKAAVKKVAKKGKYYTTNINQPYQGPIKQTYPYTSHS